MHLSENLDKIFRTKFHFFLTNEEFDGNFWEKKWSSVQKFCMRKFWRTVHLKISILQSFFFFAIQICKIKFYSKLKRRKFPFFLKKKRTVHSADLAIKKIRLEDKIEKRPMRSKKLNSNYLECFLLRPTRPDHVPSGGSRLPAHERYSNLVVVHLSPISDLPLPIGHRWNRTI